MSRSRIIPLVLAATVALGAATAGSMALAGERERGHGGAAEIQAIGAMRVTLPQAIAAAEQATGGRAIDAGVESENGRLTLKVEVLKGAERQEVTINPETGAVMHIGAADHD
jgi:uncharacterized membrane protein YkoI